MQQSEMSSGRASALLAQFGLNALVPDRTNSAGGKVYLARTHNKTITITAISPGKVRVQIMDGCTC